MRSLTLFIQTYPGACILIYSLLSLMVGSLISMLTHRIPIMIEQSESTDTPPKTTPKFNLFLPRSHCISCKKTIPFYYNIPLLSYILLKGRCHHCRNTIAWRYPLIEASTLLLSLLALYLFGASMMLVIVLPFFWLCIALVAIDLEHQLLPDMLTYSLLWLGLLINAQHVFCALSDAVWGATIAYSSLWLLIKVFYLLTGKIGMGYGDFKLFAALGAWFGWGALMPILVLACILGIIIGSVYLWLHNKTRHHPIPFGPYLCIAGISYVYMGTKDLSGLFLMSS